MTIDAKELREAIAYYDELVTRHPHAFDDKLKAVVGGARAHLATLPREVEVSDWVLVDDAGTIISRGYDDHADACRACGGNRSLYPIRLTGKATLAGKP